MMDRASISRTQRLRGAGAWGVTFALTFALLGGVPIAAQAASNHYWAGLLSSGEVRSSGSYAVTGGASLMAPNSVFASGTVYNETWQGNQIRYWASASGQEAILRHLTTNGYNRCYWYTPGEEPSGSFSADCYVDY